jgi:hypothetical protein
MCTLLEKPVNITEHFSERLTEWSIKRLQSCSVATMHHGLASFATKIAHWQSISA